MAQFYRLYIHCTYALCKIIHELTIGLVFVINLVPLIIYFDTFGIGIRIYLGCFLPGGNSAHNTIIQSNHQAYIEDNTLKRGREGKDSLTIIVHCCGS